MNTRLRLVTLTVLIVGVSGSQLHAQPFNPFNVQFPIDTSGPNGSHYDTPTDYSSRMGNPTAGGFQLGNSTAGRFAFSLTYFPIEDGTVSPLGIGQFSAETIPSPPQEAAPFFAEPFYPHLTTLLVHEELTGSMRSRLENYRRDRDQAAMEIEQKLGQLRDLPAHEAAGKWQEFAAKKNSSWASIEREKLGILNKLQNGGIWTRGVGIEESPFLRRQMSVSKTDDDQIKLRALRHFAPHLSLDQRDLIGEILAEVATAKQTEDYTLSLQISPVGRRLNLPVNPDPAFVQALEAYRKTKQQLKQDLLQALVPSIWGPENNREFVAKMKKLRKSQTPQFEKLAQQLKMVATALEDSKSSDESTNAAAILDVNPSFNPADLTLLASTERRLLAASTGRY